MPLISIRERGSSAQNENPVVVIDNIEYPLSGALTPPFNEQAEKQLEWYFEDHLRFPFTNQVRAQTTAESIKPYGETLFNQLFDDRRAYARYKTALQGGIANLAFEIAGSPEFQQYHWEALKDPDLPQPFALQSSFVRRNLSPREIEANVRTSPTINVLVVTARPGVARDVGYRTIARPLVESLRQAAVPVAIDLLRPGSYAALVAHLEAKQDQQGAGYYHVIHFDLHGGLLTFDQFDTLDKQLETSQLTFQAQRYGRGKLARYDGFKAFLMLESGASGIADPVEATELANLLLTHQIPIAILNACQSGKQIGATETSLGSQLMSAGMQMVLAMGYSVTVSAAEIMMAQLYQQLFQKGDLAAAIRSARLELHNRKARRAYFNQTIDLEDWLLPVVYQNQPQQLTTRDFTDTERTAYYERDATRYRESPVTYGFVGRDLDILHMEQRLLRQEAGRDQNLLLVRGIGGVGKSTLLHHLAAWWQATGLVEQVAYFGYDERAWTLQQILDALARQLLGNRNYITQFQPLSLAAQTQRLARHLRATRHLLILDNLESITGTNLAILNTLQPADQRALHGFLRELAGGKTLVLLGSRGLEKWLAPGTFDANVYELPGLDPEAASTLADRILARHGATQYRKDPAMQQDLQRLITLLDGHPLALEVVLANLSKQTPAQVLTALQDGGGNIEINQGQGNGDQHTKEDRTTSILACIAYSHSNLSPDAQQLLLCLAPFTGVINRQWLPQYTAQLQDQPALAGLPYARWDEVLEEAINWGLLTVDAQLPMYLRIQPIFPYFLRTRIKAQSNMKDAVSQAFRDHYDEIGESLIDTLQSNEAHTKQVGQMFIATEFENLVGALNITLQLHMSPYNIYGCLSNYIGTTKNHLVGLKLGKHVQAQIQQIPIDQLSDDMLLELARINGDIGTRLFDLKNFEDAEVSYKKALALIQKVNNLDKSLQISVASNTYHNLGMVAQEQRNWVQAEIHYQQALALKTELNDRHGQAGTYHGLGMVAQGKRQWAQAEVYYQNALTLFIEFDDRYSQAGTYCQLGLLIEEQRNWVQAEIHYQNALTLFIKFNDQHGQAITYNGLGRVAEEQRNWVQAEIHYQNALTLFIKFNDRHGQARTYHGLGVAAQEQRNWVQAEVYYQNALTLKIELNDRYSLAITYCQLGLLAEAQEQWSQAGKYLIQGLQIFVEFTDKQSIDITLRTLARLYHATGDTTLLASVNTIIGIASAEVIMLFANPPSLLPFRKH